MIRLGVTGGIGMGKSKAGEILASLGHRVADTDRIAREIVTPGQPALEEIRGAFGAGMIDASGELDRARLAELVFKDPVARARLEAILHPRIRAEWLRQLKEWKAAGVEISAVLIPLLFETAAESEFDAVVCVACSALSQRQRLRARGWSEDEIARRNAAQLPVVEKIRRSDYLVWTEPPPAEHELQWRRILERIPA